VLVHIFQATPPFYITTKLKPRFFWRRVGEEFFSVLSAWRNNCPAMKDSMLYLPLLRIRQLAVVLSSSSWTQTYICCPCNILCVTSVSCFILSFRFFIRRCGLIKNKLANVQIFEKNFTKYRCCSSSLPSFLQDKFHKKQWSCSVNSNFALSWQSFI
jgi:hypothetical protein